MAQYIKPGAMFIAAAGTGIAAGCDTSREDVELIKEILGISDWAKAFSIYEACEEQYDMEQYCKFTAVENGNAAVILTS